MTIQVRKIGTGAVYVKRGKKFVNILDVLPF